MNNFDAFMHAYMSMFECILDLYAYCGICLYDLLDCGEDQAYSCDCCSCAGCCDQGKWHS